MGVTLLCIKGIWYVCALWFVLTSSSSSWRERRNWVWILNERILSHIWATWDDTVLFISLNSIWRKCHFCLKYNSTIVVLLSCKNKGTFEVCEKNEVFSVEKLFFSVFFSENENLFSFIMSSKVLVMWNGNFPIWMDVQVYWILDPTYILYFNVLCCQEINSGKYLG